MYHDTEVRSLARHDSREITIRGRLGAVLAIAPMSARRRSREHLTFGERLRRLRKEKRLTQAELGKKAGSDGAYISKLENDDPSPGLPMIQRLADALDVHISELTGGVGGDVEEAILNSELDDEAKRSLVRIYRSLKP